MNYIAELIESIEETLDNSATEMIVNLCFDDRDQQRELFELYNAFSDKLQALATEKYPEYKFKNF